MEETPLQGWSDEDEEDNRVAAGGRSAPMNEASSCLCWRGHRGLRPVETKKNRSGGKRRKVQVCGDEKSTASGKEGKNKSERGTVRGKRRRKKIRWGGLLWSLS